MSVKLIKISPSIVNHRIVGYYFLYKIAVPRGIKRKGKSASTRTKTASRIKQNYRTARDKKTI